MNFADLKSGIGPEAPLKQSESALAPHDALKLALQEMKDRCVKLQTRISRLEEENLQLRIVKSKINDNDGLNYNRIEDLWAANKEFRDKLFKMCTDNSNVAQIPQYITQSLKQSNDRLESSVMNKVEGIKDDSMEEISLKAINTNFNDNSDYSNENKDELASLDGGEANELDSIDYLETSLKEILVNVKRNKDLIKKQQEGLKSAVQIFKGVLKDKGPCKTCQMKKEELRKRLVENKLVGTEDSLNRVSRSNSDPRLRQSPSVVDPIPVRQLPSSPPPAELKDRICPLCGKYFECLTPVDVFHNHVLSHFVEDDSELVS